MRLQSTNRRRLFEAAEPAEQRGSVHRHEETGEVRFIGASKDDPIDRPAALPENAAPEEAAHSD